MGGRFLSVQTQFEGSLTTALPTVQPLALTIPVGSFSHTRGVGSNDRDVSTADVRARAFTVPFVANADVHSTQAERRPQVACRPGFPIE
jgi:hypothetical protein